MQGQKRISASASATTGLRFYSANLARWLSRDPIGERGGLLLYLFASNDPQDAVDHLGRSDTKIDTDEQAQKKQYHLLFEENGQELTVKLVEGALAKEDVTKAFRSDMEGAINAITGGSPVQGPLNTVPLPRGAAEALSQLAKGDVDKVTISLKGVSKEAVRQFENILTIYSALTWSFGGEADKRWNEVKAKWAELAHAKSGECKACDSLCVAMTTFIESIPTIFNFEKVYGYSFSTRCHIDCFYKYGIE